jgi:NTE family protein
MATPKTLNLALQGGGAHGAFTWGVLDRILEDDRIKIAAISGTSAGAMNAVVAADGLVSGGKDVARAKLESFWHAVSVAGAFSMIQRSPFDKINGNWSLDYSPGFILSDMVSRFFSPAQLNPLGLNSLRDVLVDHVNFKNVCDCTELKLFIAATNVKTGQVKVFDHSNLTADMVMASACLPYMFEAVEIDGVPYWDGGFTGNPPLMSLYRETGCTDTAIVQINPIKTTSTPTAAREILNRMNEITFNTSLLKDLKALNLIKRLLAEGSLDPKKYHDINLHLLECQEKLEPLGASSKLNSEWAFLVHLRDLGRETAENWLSANYKHIGKKSTLDLQELFQDGDPFGLL